MNVRDAKLSDIEWMKSELKDFADSYKTSYSLYPRNDEEAEKFLTNLIGSHIVLVSEKEDGELTGLIAGALTPHYYNQELITLTELFWWVPERHRGTRAGLMLYNAFVEKGKELSNWIVFSLKGGSPVNPEFFLKRDFKLLDQNFLMEVT